MRVLVAPDKFKGTLTAAEAARVIADGWRSERPDDTLVLCPMADGGDGTASVLADALPGHEWVEVDAVDAVGVPTVARYLRAGDLAVVELAMVCGLASLAEPAPLTATTRGLGIVLDAALRSGATRVLVALGGSASTDGGAGALDELAALADYGGATVEALVDVDSPLLGPSGAARVFAPQKGATPEQVEVLEARLAAWSDRRGGDPLEPGAGAAGGTGFGLASWGARLVPGARAVGEVLGLPARVAGADVVVTGEGRFDATSLRGKTCGYVLQLPRSGAAFVLAGSAEDGVTGGAQVVRLDALAGSVEAARGDAIHWLATASKSAARALAHCRSVRDRSDG